MLADSMEICDCFGDNLHTWWQCGGNRRIACPLRQVLCYNYTYRPLLYNTSYSHIHNHLYLLLRLHKYLQCAISIDKCNIDISKLALSWIQTQIHIMEQVLCRTTCDQADWITFNFLQFRHHPSSPLVTRPPHAIAIKLYWRCNLHRFHSSRLHRLFGHDPDYSGG